MGQISDKHDFDNDRVYQYASDRDSEDARTGRPIKEKKTVNLSDGDLPIQEISSHNFDTPPKNTKSVDETPSTPPRNTKSVDETPSVPPFTTEEMRPLPDIQLDEETVDAQQPFDLDKCSYDEISELCREHNVSIISKNKYELIGRLLIIFPRETLTESNLNKFSEKNLRRMAKGAHISSRGEKKEIVVRLIKYGKNNIIEPPTPQQQHETPLHPDRTPYRTPSTAPAKSTSHKRPRDSFEDSDRPLKKLKLPKFLDLAPDVPFIIDTRYYKASPSFEGDTALWKKEGKQVIKVGLQDIPVRWKLEIIVDKEEKNVEPFLEGRKRRDETEYDL